MDQRRKSQESTMEQWSDEHHDVGFHLFERLSIK